MRAGLRLDVRWSWERSACARTFQPGGRRSPTATRWPPSAARITSARRHQVFITGSFCRCGRRGDDSGTDNASVARETDVAGRLLTTSWRGHDRLTSLAEDVASRSVGRTAADAADAASSPSTEVARGQDALFGRVYAATRFFIPGGVSLSPSRIAPPVSTSANSSA